MAKNIGYELRCADPIPFDMEYTRDLGLLRGRSTCSRAATRSMVSIQGGTFVPIPFDKHARRRDGPHPGPLVDVRSTRYAIARRYMIRLRRDDFEDPHALAKLAATCGFSPEEFRREFAYLVEDEPPALVLEGRARGRRRPVPRLHGESRGHAAPEVASPYPNAGSE